MNSQPGSIFHLTSAHLLLVQNIGTALLYAKQHAHETVSDLFFFVFFFLVLRFFPYPYSMWVFFLNTMRICVGCFFSSSFIFFRRLKTKVVKKDVQGAKRKSAVRANEYIPRAPSNHSNWVLPPYQKSRVGKEKYEIIIRDALQW